MTPNPPQSLTARQAEVFQFLERFIAANGFSPTTREIMTEFEFASTNAAFCHLKRLERKGWIDFQPKLSRSIVVLHASDPIASVRRSLRALSTDKSIIRFDFKKNPNLLEDVRGELRTAKTRIESILRWLDEEAA